MRQRRWLGSTRSPAQIGSLRRWTMPSSAQSIWRLLEWGGTSSEVDESLRLLAVPIADFDADLANVVIKLRRQTRSAGLSLADRACLALAMREGATALTADRVWADLDIDCEVELIR